MQMFGLGFSGHLCRSADDIRSAATAALADKHRPHLINIAIDPAASRKAQSFEWLTRSKM